MGIAVNHHVPDRVKPSFVIFDNRRSALSVRVPGCQKLQITAKSGLAQDALQLDVPIATVGVKGY